MISRYLLGVLLWLSFLSPAYASVPSLRDLGIDPVSLSPVLGRSQLLLLHKERTHHWVRDEKKFKKKATFVTSIRVVDAPVAKVREVVAGVEKYGEFIHEVEDVTATQSEEEKLAEFETELNMMVLSFDVDYTLAYQNQPNGDITWRLVEGDYDEHLGRWEFFALPGDKTLLAYTAWQDFASIGFTVRTIMAAQPDLKLIIPVASAAVLVNAVSRRAEGLPPEDEKPTRVAKTPTVPMLSTGAHSIPLPELRKLAEAGTLILLHPVQWFAGTKGKAVDFSFMSAAALVDLPAEKSRDLATSFDRFPEFIKQVKSVDKSLDEKGNRIFDYKLSVGLSILSVSVQYGLAYTDVTPFASRFERVSGELEYVHGAWEFFDVGDGKSLVVYTTASKLGEGAPAILKIGEDMPNRDLLVGISASAITMQKLVPWLHGQTENPGH